VAAEWVPVTRHSQTSALNVELRDRIVETAHARRRWGYRMIHDVLRPQYPNINHKRVYRLYTTEGLSIRKRKKNKRIGVRVPLVAALAVNQTWSMDFVSDAIARPGAVSRRIKCLAVAADFSHECVDITADFGIGGAYVTRLLDRAATFRGYSKEACDALGVSASGYFDHWRRKDIDRPSRPGANKRISDEALPACRHHGKQRLDLGRTHVA